MSAAASSTKSTSARPSLPAMAVSLFGAGARHGAQQVLHYAVHRFAACAGLVVQHQAVAGNRIKHSGHILRGNKIPPRQVRRRARHAGQRQGGTGA